MGLALLTKTTAYIFAFPFLAWLGISLLKPLNIKGVIRLAIAMVMVIVINFGQYMRNGNLFGNPFGITGDKQDSVYTNETINVPAFTSNVIRNMSFHLRIPSTEFNAEIYTLINKVHQKIGVSPDDPRTTWPGTKFSITNALFHEDQAGNFTHFILLLICIVSYVILPKKNHNVNLYFAMLIFGFSLFCLILKWQPWNSRLELPLFVLSSSYIGYVISFWRPRFATLLGIWLLLSCLPWVFYNQIKPLYRPDNIFNTNRTEQYFYSNLEIKQAYFEAVKYLNNANCSNVGLLLGGDDWEYPLWMIMDPNMDNGLVLEHVNVTNNSSRYANTIPERNLCAVFSTWDIDHETLTVEGRTFTKSWQLDPVSVFLPNP